MSLDQKSEHCKLEEDLQAPKGLERALKVCKLLWLGRKRPTPPPLPPPYPPSPPPPLTSSSEHAALGFLVYSEVFICSLDPDDSQSSTSSSNLFPSLIQIQISIRQLLIMQTVFALFLGYLPSVTLNLSSSPFSPCLAHLLFPVC